MRLVGFTIGIFVNLMFFGMAGYMYILWMYYWKSSSLVLTTKDNTPYTVNKRILSERDAPAPPHLRRKQVSTVIGGVPSKEKPTATITTTEVPTTTMSLPNLKRAVGKHKEALLVHLRQAQMDGGNILFKHENKYGVVFKRSGTLDSHIGWRDILCSLKRVPVRSLRDGDEPFTTMGIAKYFPHREFFEGRFYNACAVVSSAASLRGSRLGPFIDSHEVVLRFNHAPISGFERDVGGKTTVRIVNSQVVTKPEFRFWDSSLYQNVTLLVWDPCNYTASLEQWYKSPDFEFFSDYFKRRLMLPQEELHLLHPQSLWRLWDFLQQFTRMKLLPNPPSSGFLGIVLMLSHCAKVNIIEYLPSLRLSKRCHYWSEEEDSGCTFGTWHPLAAEKLTILALNQASDMETFHRGYISVPGITQMQCPS